MRKCVHVPTLECEASSRLSNLAVKQENGVEPVPRVRCVPPHILCEATITRRLPVGFCRSHQKRHPARGSMRNGRQFLPMLESRGFRARPW